MCLDKIKNKYRIPSARLQTWDYGSNGSYFVTICTKNQIHFFGDIMQLNETGKIAERYWIEIPNHFPFIELGCFVVMPNQVHGILIIDKLAAVETPNLGISVINKTTTIKSNNGKNDKCNPGTIGVIINQYKRMVTTHARKTNMDFGWHPVFMTT